MTLIREYQLNLMLILSGICFCLIFFTAISKALNKQRRYNLICLQLTAAVMLIADRNTYIYDGDISKRGIVMAWTSNFMVFFLTPLVMYFFYAYVENIYLNEGHIEEKIKRLKICRILSLIASLMVVLSQFTGAYYYFDEHNYYQKSSLYALSYVLPMIVLILGTSVVLQYYRRISTNLSFLLLLFSIGPVLSSVIQNFIHGISLGNIVGVSTVIALYISSIGEANRSIEKATELEIQLLKKQQETDSGTIQSISNIYYILYLVNLKEDSFLEVKSPEFVSKFACQFTSARECLGNISALLLIEEEAEHLKEFFDITTFTERLKDKDTESMEVIGKYSGWIRFTIIASTRDEEGEASQVIICVQNIDAEKTKLLNLEKEQAERQRQLDETLLKLQYGEQMKGLFKQTAEALASAIDAKDKYTHGHSVRVAEYSRKMAEMAGKSEEECDEVYFAGLLHDVGKIGIPDLIINKTGRLTDEEFDVIKKHPGMGKQILTSIDKLPYLSIGANSHHERYDGRGYPEALKGTDIPELARIIAVADAYDAMSSKRSYRDPLPQQKIREEILKGMGTQFDPIYAKHMIHLIDLDSEYKMKEREDVKELAGNEELICTDYKKQYSEGILLNSYKVHIHLTSEREDLKGGLPSFILFDSLDARIHISERDRMHMNYSHYGDISADGTYTEGEIREMEITQTGEFIADDLRMEMDIEAVKVKDHLYITASGGNRTTEMILALPDSTRYAYIAITGDRCHIYDVSIEREENETPEEGQKRLVEELNFIDGPEGDIPNVQINGWRGAASQAIPIKDSLSLEFHMKSLPMARLVWHLPFVLIFSADDAQVRGKNYREFASVRFDGEAWQEDAMSHNRLIINKTEAFTGWDEWKAENKRGRDCKLTITRKGNQFTMITACGGIELNNLTTIEGEIPELYFAFTGDQCVIENIHILK